MKKIKNEKVIYTSLFILELVIWGLFIGIGFLSSDFYVVVIIWSFFVGRHFTMLGDILKAINLVKKKSLEDR